MSVTDIAGVRVGHWTDAAAQTGCTVILPPMPNIATVEVRGAAPGSRELALLGPGMSVQEVSAIVLTGGSAFGLAAADGVMAACERDQRGHPTPGGIVPIVPAAVIFDLAIGDGSVRPTAAAGRAAYENASGDSVGSGRFGAGAGATVAKWRGVEAVQLSGIGSGSATANGATVGVLTVLNAFGDVYRRDGTALSGGPGLGEPAAGVDGSPLMNTTLSCVITDVVADRPTLARMAVRAHDAFGAMIAPTHTRFDGDTVFLVSTGTVPMINEEAFGDAVFLAVCRSIEAGAEIGSQVH